MVSTWVGKKPTNYSYRLSDIRMDTNHVVHQTSDCRGIRNPIMSSFSSWLVGQLYLLSLKWLANGVLIGLALCMLNLSKTHSTYFSYNNHSFLDFQSCKICIPKMCLASPRSFMSNTFDNSFFQIANHFPILLHYQYIISI